MESGINNQKKVINRCCVRTDFGDFYLFFRGSKLIRLDNDASLKKAGSWFKKYFPDALVSEEENAPADKAGAQLKAYFEGRLKHFSISYELYGTEYQKKVWNALTGIPYGKRVSYGALARSCGIKSGFRAVGGAVGRNPIMILIPCHRVIRADGGLSGFGGGIDLKKALLRLESDHI